MITSQLNIPESHKARVVQALDQFYNLLNSETFIIPLGSQTFGTCRIQFWLISLRSSSKCTFLHSTISTAETNTCLYLCLRSLSSLPPAAKSCLRPLQTNPMPELSTAVLLALLYLSIESGERSVIWKASVFNLKAFMTKASCSYHHDRKTVFQPHFWQLLIQLMTSTRSPVSPLNTAPILLPSTRCSQETWKPLLGLLGKSVPCARNKLPTKW